MAYLSPTIAAKRASRSGETGGLTCWVHALQFYADHRRRQGRRRARRAASRSLIASPRPSFGIGITAMRCAPEASSARRCENRLAAASTRSPRGRQIERSRGARRRIGAEREQRFAGPHVDGVRAAAAPSARSARRACRARAALRPAIGCSAIERARWPSTRSIASRGRPPGRSSVGAPRHDTMVDSTPTLARSAVDDQVDAAVEIGEHVLRRSSATHGRTGWPTARPPACRTPSGDRARPDDPARAPRSMSSPAVASSDTGQPSAFGSTSVSGPGQNAPASSFARHRKARERERRRGVRHMRDQRIEARPALGGVEPRDRLAVGRVGAEAVDRLGRKRDQPAVGEHARGRRDRVAVGVAARVSPVRRA